MAFSIIAAMLMAVASSSCKKESKEAQPSLIETISPELERANRLAEKLRAAHDKLLGKWECIEPTNEGKSAAVIEFKDNYKFHFEYAMKPTYSGMDWQTELELAAWGIDTSNTQEYVINGTWDFRFDDDEKTILTDIEYDMSSLKSRNVDKDWLKTHFSEHNKARKVAISEGNYEIAQIITSVTDKEMIVKLDVDGKTRIYTRVGKPRDSKNYDFSADADKMQKLVTDMLPRLQQSSLSSSDLSGYNTKQLKLLRNALFAVHGYRFKMKEYADFFKRFSWYEPRYDKVDDQFSDVERHNIDLIKSLE